MNNQKKILPLFKSDGTWIERPDLYLFAVMSPPTNDKNFDSVVKNTYDALCQSDNSSPELNNFDQKIKKQIMQNMKQRRRAARVVGEAIRIRHCLPKALSASNAIKLATLNAKEDGINTTEENLIQGYKIAFLQYRNTAHLQAAHLIGGKNMYEIEGSLENFLEFLSWAKLFELEIDRLTQNVQFKWDPWRVPAQVSEVKNFEVVPLTDRERNFLNNYIISNT